MAQPIDFRLGLPRVREINIPEGQQSLSAFFGGFTSGFERETKRQEAKKLQKSGASPAPESGDTAATADAPEVGATNPMLSFSRGFIETPGVIRRAQDPESAIMEKLLAQRHQMGMLQIEDAIRQRDLAIEGKATRQQFGAFLQDAIRNRSTLDPGFQKGILEFLSRDPSAASDPGIVGTLQQIRRSQEFERQLKTLEEQREAIDASRKAGLEQTRRTIETPTGTLTMEAPDATDQTTQTERLLQRLRDAQSRGDEQEVQNIMALAGRSGTTITTRSPDGTVVSVTQGGRGGGSDLTTANLTKAQENFQSALTTIQLTDRLIQLVSTETVGPVASIKGFLVDRGLANIYPGLASEDRAEFLTSVTELQASFISEHKSDGNISERERERLLDAVPEVGRIIDSPANANNVLRSINKLAALRALKNAQILNRPTPEQAMKGLEKPEDIRDAFRLGLITWEQAIEQIQKRGGL